MSAETLREAASLMRARASSATGSPWVNDDSTPAPSVYSIGDDIYVTDPTNWDADGGDTPHIASWHPAVALAVAEWLDATAQRIEEIQDSLPFTARLTMSSLNVTAVEQALAVARAYLGKSA